MTHDHMTQIVSIFLCAVMKFLFVIMERPLVIEPTKMDRAMQEKNLSHALKKRSFLDYEAVELVMQLS